MDKREILKLKRAKVLKRIQENPEAQTYLAKRKTQDGNPEAYLEAVKQVNWLIGKVSTYFDELQTRSTESGEKFATISERFADEVTKVEKTLKAIADVNESAQMLQELRDVKGALKAIAAKEIPKPVVNVPAPVVNVAAPETKVIDNTRTEIVHETKYQEQTVKTLEQLMGVLEKVVKNTTGRQLAHIENRNLSEAIPVQLVDKRGKAIFDFSDFGVFMNASSGGGSAQYQEGQTDASLVGNILMWEDTGDTAVATSATKPLPVAIISGSSAGTQYTEDVAAAADPVGTAVNLIRKDTPAAITGADGDNIAQRGTNYGAGYVQVVTSSGAFVDTFGGGTQYTEGDVDASITGTAVMWEGAADTLYPVSAATPLPITVISSALPTGAATSAKQDTIIGHVDGIETLIGTTNTTLTTIDGRVDGIETLLTAIDGHVDGLEASAATIAGAVSGTEMQVDVLTMPTVTVVASNLDIRDLSSVSDSVSAVQSGTWSVTADTELTTSDMDTGAGTDTRAVVGMVLAESGGGVLVGSANPLPTSVASLPLPSGASTAANQATIISHLDGVETLLTAIDGHVDGLEASAATIAGAVAGTEMQVDVLTMPTVTVTATNLDIRDLAAAGDSVSVHGDVGIIDQFDLLNSNPAAVAIVDANGDQITSFGGGVQYTEGDTDASITGTAMMWEDTADTLRAVSVAKPLPVRIGDGTDVADVIDLGTYAGIGSYILDASGNPISSFGGGTQYTEDAASAGGETMTLAGAVRQDTLATSTSLDGDYAYLKVNAAGALYTAISTLPGTVVEDAASAGGETMHLMGVVRQDTPASSTSTDGDFTWLKVNDVGRLHTITQITTHPALTASSPVATTAGTSSASLVASNSSRKGLIVTNYSNNWVFLAFSGTTAVVEGGVPLAPNGGSYSMTKDDFTTGQVNAIATAASSKVAVQEYT